VREGAPPHGCLREVAAGLPARQVRQFPGVLRGAPQAPRPPVVISHCSRAPGTGRVPSTTWLLKWRGRQPKQESGASVKREAQRARHHLRSSVDTFDSKVVRDCAKQTPRPDSEGLRCEFIDNTFQLARVAEEEPLPANGIRPEPVKESLDRAIGSTVLVLPRIRKDSQMSAAR
jgi:hypothetical protein